MGLIRHAHKMLHLRGVSRAGGVFTTCGDAAGKGHKAVYFRQWGDSPLQDGGVSGNGPPALADIGH
jgi:hypothetical protein